MKTQTKATSINDIKRIWHKVDVKDKVLGRIAQDIVKLLMGKGKPNYAPFLDMGDYVVVTNAKDVATTGKKEEQKKYYRHSGYPGGFRQEVLKDLRSRRPEDVIEHAVKGMLPQNKLKSKMIKRLFIFPGEEHTYNDKFKNKS